MALDLAKDVFLEYLIEELDGGVVEEENLDRLEDYVKTLQGERYGVSDTVKEAYCQVAFYSTAKYLTYKENAREFYTEAIRRIWLRRIMPLCDKVSVLVTRDLLHAFRRLWAAHNDEIAWETLKNENKRQKALDALRILALEMNPDIDFASGDGYEFMGESEETESSVEIEETESSVEIEERESMVEEEEREVKQESEASEAVYKDKEEARDEIGETESMAEARDIEVNQNCKASEAVDKEKGEIGETESMAEARDIEVNQSCKAFEALDKEKGEIGETDSMVEARDLEVNQSCKESEAVDKEKGEIGETDSMAEARDIEVNQNCKESEAVDKEKGEIRETESMAEARDIEVNQNCKVSEAVDEEKGKIGETDSIVEARDIEVNQHCKASEAVDKEKENLFTTEVERLPAGECETASPPLQIKSTSSVVVDSALGGLSVIKHELVNALEEGIPSNLNNEMQTELEDDVCRPSAPSTALRPSLMERSSTAHTYEWDDSIDTSAEELSDEGESNNRSKRKRIVMCPLKRGQSSESGGRRKRIPWTSAETEALMKGYEMYGANWKLIKDEFSILERRTNLDLKDKFRVEMRREEPSPKLE